MKRLIATGVKASLAVMAVAVLPATALAQGTYMTCKQDFDALGFNFKTGITGEVYDGGEIFSRPTMDARSRMDIVGRKVKLAKGARASEDGPNGMVIYYYKKPSWKHAGGTFITDMRFDVNDLLYDRVIGYDELDGTISIVLRDMSGAALAKLPIYSDVYYGNPALDTAMGFSTKLSYGAEGGISASKDDKQSFVTRITTQIERMGGNFTVSVQDNKKSDMAKDAIASFTVPGHDVHAVRVKASKTLDADLNRLKSGQCKAR